MHTLIIKMACSLLPIMKRHKTLQIISPHFTCFKMVVAKVVENVKELGQFILSITWLIEITLPCTVRENIECFSKNNL